MEKETRRIRLHDFVVRCGAFGGGRDFLSYSS